MKITSNFVLPMLVSVGLLGSTTLAFARGHGGWGYGHQNTHLSAYLTPDASSPNKIGQGELEFTGGSNMSNFTGGITVPVDGTFIDVNAAVNATVNIALTGATCTMKIDDIRFGYTAAENTVKVAADYDLIGNTKSTGSPTYNIGSCVDASGTIVLPKMTSG